jgi:6-pyruvoyltetrahydropterin/6-carboxytetrahydropterin synthase
MFRVSKEIEFCYGHRLLNYSGKCRHLHGHNGKAIITLEGPDLDERGMLMDFKDLKSTVSKWIDDTLDHTMLLNQADPLIPILQAQGERLLVVPENPTAEAIARMIYRQAVADGLPVVEVQLWETPTSYAVYTE